MSLEKDGNMIRKRVKKIFKLTGLIGIRQAWGLLCNLYLLGYQPFLTLRTIKGKRDKSQFVLVSGVAIMPVIVYVIARICWDYFRYGRILEGVGVVFTVMVLIEGLIFSYLLYWTMRVIRKNHTDLFVGKM